MNPNPRRRPLALTVAAAAVAAALSPLLVVTPAAAAIGECPPGYLPAPDTPDGNEIWSDDNVAVYAGGDFLADGAAAESEGLLVVEGDATFDKSSGGRFNVGWVGVGSQVAPTPGSTMLAVGGSLTVGSSTILDVGSGARDDEGTLLGGDVLVGEVASPEYPAAQYDLNNGSLQTDMGASALADYATFGGSVAANSAAYAATPDTALATVAGASITFLGNGFTDGSVEVFTVQAATLNAITEVNFVNVADDSPVVINVVGDVPITFSPNYFSDDGVRADDLTSSLFGLVAQRTMWNFVDATSVTFGGSGQFLGSVMAPNADFDITASMNGRVYAGGDIHMHGVGNELHNYPWIYDFECVPDITPEATGSVELTKILDGDSVAEGDRRFFGWIECDGPDVDGSFYQEGEIRAGETITVSGLPIGATCQVFEDPDAAIDGQEPLPPGFLWAAPVWTVNGEVVDEPIFEVVDPAAPVQVAITVANTLLGTAGDFAIAWDCGVGGAGTVSLGAGETSEPIVVPLGSTCEVSEPDLPEAPAGWDWGTPAVNPSMFSVSDAQTVVAVTVTNTIAPADESGWFTIEKIVRNPDAITSYTADFTGTVECVAGDWSAEFAWALSAGDTSDLYEVPLGARCTVSEDAPDDPARASWSEPEISPASFTVSDSASVIAVTVTNTLRGDLAVTGGAVAFWVLILGSGLLATGIASVVVARRRGA